MFWTWCLQSVVFKVLGTLDQLYPLRWRHNERDGISNHQPRDCLLNRLFRRRSKKTSKLRVIGLCEGNSPVTGEFPAQRASNAENVSIWWRHHAVMSPECSMGICGVARLSTATALIMKNKRGRVIHEEIFKLHTLFYREKYKYILIVPQMGLTHNGQVPLTKCPSWAVYLHRQRQLQDKNTCTQTMTHITIRTSLVFIELS